MGASVQTWSHGMPDMNAIVGTHDIVFITLDTLRFDVASALMKAGRTPNFSAWIGKDWEKRHTPGTFTYAAHHAFFAGFLPTPAAPGRHPRLFAAKFGGSETTTTQTAVFEEATIVEGLRNRGYRSMCIGGVGFFNQQTPLGNVFPSMFDEAEWTPEFGVTHPKSAELQFGRAAQWLDGLNDDQRAFLFINVSAMHQPNRHYIDGADDDDLHTHAAAFEYVDSCLPILAEALSRRDSVFCIVCADHGTAYGEDGFEGHRLAHDVVTHVPYAEFLHKKDVLWDSEKR